MSRIFFDIDGTLNNITKALLDEDGKVQVEKIYKDKKFYENIEPEKNMIVALKQLAEKSNYEIFIISACELGDPPGFEKQKDNWLDKNKIPVSYSNRIYVGFNEKKTDCIPGGIQDGDILIDDYNKNLDEWESEGISKGVKSLGIKVCTDYNDTGEGLCGGEKNKRWVGERVSTRKSPEQNVSIIECAIDKLNSPEQYNMQAVSKNISIEKSKDNKVEKLYLDSISSVCLSIVADIEISPGNKVAIIKEYEDDPFYYLSTDYEIKGNAIEVISKGNPINTLQEAEKALFDYFLRCYDPKTHMGNNQDKLSDEYSKWFITSGSYRPLYEQFVSYFSNDMLTELVKSADNSLSDKVLEYMDEYLATNGFKINKLEVIKNAENMIETAQKTNDKIQSIEVLHSQKENCFDVVAKFQLGRQCLITKPNKTLANNIADDLSEKYNIRRSSSISSTLVNQNQESKHSRK